MSDPILIINFEGDLKRILLARLKKARYQISESLSCREIVRAYFNIRIREIELRTRKVILSPELQSNPLFARFKDVINAFTRNSLSANNLNRYLSTELQDVLGKDQLLFDWGIHHFHLGKNLNKKGFVERTRNLLFGRVTPDEIYLIDILDHHPIDSFSNQALLQIVHDNWAETIMQYRVNGLGPNHLTNHEIHKVRKANATTMISVSDGTTYFPVGGGYASDGSSIGVTRVSDYLYLKITGMQDAIVEDQESFRRQMESNGIILPRTIKLKLLEWDEQGILVAELKCKTTVRVGWPIPKVSAGSVGD